MYLLENVFTNEHGEAITVLQLLTKFKTVLSEIDTYLNEYGNRLNSIEFLNVTQQQEIIILKSQVASLQTKVNNIQLTLGDYLLRFQDLDSQISVINGKIDVNISDIATLKTYVNNLGIQVIGINNTLNLLGLTVQGHTTKITNLETTITSINSDLVDIDSSISLINTQLSNLAAFITDFESRLAVLETKVNNIGKNIIAINNLFNVLDLTVQGYATQITDLEGDILTINNKNADQDTTLISHDDRITVLENQVSIEHELIPHDNLNSYYTVTANTYLNIFPFPVDITKYLQDEYLTLVIEGNISIARNGTPTLTFMLPNNNLLEFTLPTSTDSYGFINFKLYFNFVISTTYSVKRLYYWGNLIINEGSNNFNKSIGPTPYQPTGTYSTFPIQNPFFKVKCTTDILHRGHFLVTNFK